MRAPSPASVLFRRAHDAPGLYNRTEHCHRLFDRRLGRRSSPIRAWIAAWRLSASTKRALSCAPDRCHISTARAERSYARKMSPESSSVCASSARVLATSNAFGPSASSLIVSARSRSCNGLAVLPREASQIAEVLEAVRDVRMAGTAQADPRRHRTAVVTAPPPRSQRDSHSRRPGCGRPPSRRHCLDRGHCRLSTPGRKSNEPRRSPPLGAEAVPKVVHLEPDSRVGGPQGRQGYGERACTKRPRQQRIAQIIDWEGPAAEVHREGPGDRPEARPQPVLTHGCSSSRAWTMSPSNHNCSPRRLNAAASSEASEGDASRKATSPLERGSRTGVQALSLQNLPLNLQGRGDERIVWTARAFPDAHGPACHFKRFIPKLRPEQRSGQSIEIVRNVDVVGTKRSLAEHERSSQGDDRRLELAGLLKDITEIPQTARDGQITLSR